MKINRREKPNYEKQFSIIIECYISRYMFVTDLFWWDRRFLNYINILCFLYVIALRNIMEYKLISVDGNMVHTYLDFSTTELVTVCGRTRIWPVFAVNFSVVNACIVTYLSFGLSLFFILGLIDMYDAYFLIKGVQRENGLLDTFQGTFHNYILALIFFAFSVLMCQLSFADFWVEGLWLCNYYIGSHCSSLTINKYHYEAEIPGCGGWLFIVITRSFHIWLMSN